MLYANLKKADILSTALTKAKYVKVIPHSLEGFTFFFEKLNRILSVEELDAYVEHFWEVYPLKGGLL